ncbi:TetR/AcrR family transcriptional regulator [Qipengyuania qiaonensis]|uniref:TetR/AcrR family transcriptional regulator n=1 Tax=Qipengyuania qiaonensis TaxID=2867240 RepID=A0ABS7J7E0_9SPHN|nr:TetR/AcrR family transcriptional regulator [Qipengyuania qiaonensis]MBX7483234.1 TetR/AcrR family transcriptional regulator [Qipengyuania qiaonensis]
MPAIAPPGSERVPRTQTRKAIVDAFTALALRHRYETIRASDIIANAGVGKSTFYEHFRGKNDVLLHAMQPVVLALATAASGRAARSYIRETVRHLWDRRLVGRALLDSTTGPVFQRSLAEAIRTHAVRAGLGDSAAAIAARGIAAAQLAMLRSWLAGEATSTIDDMTDSLVACSRLLRSGSN